MKDYHNILFISTGILDETEALKQALSITRNNQAKLTALIIIPKFPVQFIEYEKKYMEMLKKDLWSSIKKAAQLLKLDMEVLSISMEVENKNKSSISIIKQVLKNSYDLVIKQAEEKENNEGFKALDMDLLRQCPCPVWISRPIKKHRQDIKIAVAVDPENDTAEEYRYFGNGHSCPFRNTRASNW